MKPSDITVGQALNLNCDNEWPQCDEPAVVVAIKGHEVMLKRPGIGHIPSEQGFLFTERAKDLRPYCQGYGAVR
jgi:hypothetical protein